MSRSRYWGPMMRKIAWYTGVPLVAFVGGFVSGMTILDRGLLVAPVLIVWYLSAVFVALVAALGASWAGTWFALDRTRSRLSRVVLVSEVVAIVVAVALMFVPATPRFLFLGGVVTVALAASWAAWRFRDPWGGLGRDAVVALILAGVVFVIDVFVLSRSTAFYPFDSWVGPIVVAASVSVGVIAMVLGVILVRWCFRGSGDQTSRDAALTLGLMGLPAPVFFGATYVALLMGMTPG